MIIMIILIALTVLTIAGGVIYLATDGDEEVGAMFLGIVSGPLLLALIICGAVCIGVNQPASVATKEYELAERMRLYAFDKQILESYHPITDGSNKTEFTSDITLDVVSTTQYYQMVKDYNSELYEFKCEVKSAQYNKSNPWISWFVSDGYASVSDEMLASLEYTIGK